MAIKLVSCIGNKELCRKFKKLYIKSFPAEERAPYLLLLNRAKKGKADMFCAISGDEFMGILYMLSDEKIAYIFYLAVNEEKRGKGVGGEILSAMKDYYKGKRIFLARERIEKSSPNFNERIKRRNFYIRNGFTDYPDRFIREGIVVYAFMGIGGSVSAKEYDILIKNWIGKFLTRTVRLEIIENNTEEYNEDI